MLRTVKLSGVQAFYGLRLGNAVVKVIKDSSSVDHSKLEADKVNELADKSSDLEELTEM